MLTVFAYSVVCLSFFFFWGGQSCFCNDFHIVPSDNGEVVERGVLTLGVFIVCHIFPIGGVCNQSHPEQPNGWRAERRDSLFEGFTAQQVTKLFSHPPPSAPTY